MWSKRESVPLPGVQVSTGLFAGFPSSVQIEEGSAHNYCTTNERDADRAPDPYISWCIGGHTNCFFARRVLSSFLKRLLYQLNIDEL